jgi:predicted transcriptional regulator
LSKYRNRIEIIADILGIVKNGARKTQIMYKGNLSYKLLTYYLHEVVGSELVYIGENASIYQLTEKGEAFLRHFENYSRSCTEAEQHLNNMKSLRAMLEEMCIFKHSSEYASSDGDANNSEKSNRNDAKRL